MVCMTTMHSGLGRIPEFTLGWRMRLALESAEMSVQQMAEALGYSRSTVSRWLNDQDEPRAAVMAQWSVLTKVDPTWLANGSGSTPPPPPPHGGQPTPDGDELARLTQKKRTRHAETTTRGYVAAA